MIRIGDKVRMKYGSFSYYNALLPLDAYDKVYQVMHIIYDKAILYGSPDISYVVFVEDLRKEDGKNA